MLHLPSDFGMDTSYVMNIPYEPIQLSDIESTFTHIADPIVQYAPFFDAQTLCAASGVCKRWREATGDNALWEKRFKQDFAPFNPYILLGSNFLWKIRYRYVRQQELEKKLQIEEATNLAELQQREAAVIQLEMEEVDESCQSGELSCRKCSLYFFGVLGVLGQICGIITNGKEGYDLLNAANNTTRSLNNSYSILNGTQKIMNSDFSRRVNLLLTAESVQFMFFMIWPFLGCFALCCDKIFRSRLALEIYVCTLGTLVLGTSLPPIILGGLGIANRMPIGGSLLLASGSIITCLPCTAFVCGKIGACLSGLSTRVGQLLNRCWSRR